MVPVVDRYNFSLATNLINKKYDVLVNYAGTVYYYKKGTELLHREDGPAVIYKSGTKFWYQNGEHHRVDGPAIEHENGNREWWVNGEHHRTDGPAIEWNDGTKAWWVDGKRLSAEKEEILNQWWDKKNGIRY